MRTAARPNLNMPMIAELAGAIRNHAEFELHLRGQITTDERRAAIAEAVRLLETSATPKSCWDILGVRPNATFDEIEAASVQLSQQPAATLSGARIWAAEVKAARDEAVSLWRRRRW